MFPLERGLPSHVTQVTSYERGPAGGVGGHSGLGGVWTK
jgi:hypothetical protein